MVLGQVRVKSIDFLYIQVAEHQEGSVGCHAHPTSRESRWFPRTLESCYALDLVVTDTNTINGWPSKQSAHSSKCKPNGPQLPLSRFERRLLFFLFRDGCGALVRSRCAIGPTKRYPRRVSVSIVTRMVPIIAQRLPQAVDGCVYAFLKIRKGF